MALKKREPDRYGEHLRRLPSARLFINDVEDVCNMLATEAGQVAITAGEFTADTPVDLADLSSKDRRRVTLVSTEPVIKVNFSKGEVTYRDKADSTDLLARRLVDRVAEGKSRVFPVLRPWMWAFIIWFLLDSIYVALLLWSLAIQNKLGDPSLAEVINVFGPLVPLMFLAFAYLDDDYHYVRVYPRRRGDHRAFIAQNRLTWITSVSTFILGALLGHFWK